jgi:putative transcriptional regulator
MLNLTNHFLVSMPTQNSDIFSGSVVYVTEHAVDSGAVGVIINKPLGKTLKNAFKDVDFAKYHPKWSDSSLYLGGPISRDNGFVLHRNLDDDDKLFELTNNRNVLTEIANSEYKNDLFIAVGYAAWSPFQIEHEISNNNWLVVQANIDLIFAVDPLERYDEAMRLLGIKNISQLYCGGGVFA